MWTVQRASSVVEIGNQNSDASFLQSLFPGVDLIDGMDYCIHATAKLKSGPNMGTNTDKVELLRFTFTSSSDRDALLKELQNFKRTFDEAIKRAKTSQMQDYGLACSSSVAWAANSRASRHRNGPGN